MKILLLPLFRMPSGHHKAAEAIISHLSSLEEKIDVKMIDCLSHFHSGIESIVSHAYIKWISRNPVSYSKFYHSFISPGKRKESSFPRFSVCFWDKYFEWRMEKFIKEEAPDFIICTHCYPSKLLNNLKRQGKTDVPVINVYTDFFMNDIWGKTHIDFHFVPHQEAKEQLIKKYSLKQEQVFVTGIPIHPAFSKPANDLSGKYVLIAGGNSGLGHLTTLIERLTVEKPTYSYKILCGNNKKLFDWLRSLQHKKIEPIAYTNCRAKMNRFYEEASAIITKPGGITITEVLEKSLPVFVLGALPGQEEINMDYLKKHRLIYEIDVQQSIELQIIQVIDNEIEMNKWYRRLAYYHLEKEMNIENSLLTVLTSKAKTYVSPLKKSARDSYLG
ncbi:MGDG synthase family glycosyltransferase [Bacillus aerolatus]|nr:hypothetical protein [Bacillus aerolatus]